MNDFAGIKELYDVNLRLNRPLEIGGKKYDINESILSFKSAELAQINEQKTSKQARGGLYNQVLIDWTIDKEMPFAMQHGVLSPTSWALLSNSKLQGQKEKSVGITEELHTLEDEQYCCVELKFWPNCIERLGAQPNPDFMPHPQGRRPELMLKPLPPSKTKWLFCYDMETGHPIRDVTIYNNRLFFKQFYRKVLVDYTFTYEDNVQVIEVGNRLLNGFLRLDGKMSVKDEKSGRVTTAILELPKIKLSSNLSMRLGKGYEYSTVSDFYFTGYPEEDNKNGTIARVTFLDTELTGDYI